MRRGRQAGAFIYESKTRSLLGCIGSHSVSNISCPLGVMARMRAYCRSECGCGSTTVTKFAARKTRSLSMHSSSSTTSGKVAKAISRKYSKGMSISLGNVSEREILDELSQGKCEKSLPTFGAWLPELISSGTTG